MKAPRNNVPHEVTAKQARASDPEISAFVAANAGAGKTHVLVHRVIRLLLAGVAPEKILCITFTKAAAANMAERVFSTLRHWVTLNDADLDAAILSTGATRPDAAIRKRARELFACALETPGGLKVQTIHALCTRLLQQFPFEANVPARFAVLDDRDQNDMMERANLGVLLEAANAPESELGRALTLAMTQAADVTFKDVVREACLSREHFMAWSDSAGSIDVAMTQVARTLNIGADERLEDVNRDILDGPHLPRAEWRNIAAVLQTGAKTDAAQADRLLTAEALDGVEQLNRYLSVFLTDKQEPRKSLATKKVNDARPDVAVLLDREQQRIGPLLEKRRAILQRDRTRALLTIASAVSANYRREKQARGLLDYDDLIDKTLEMLNNVASGWVHFKLDRGVDHVLIDEAQDTSPRQWDIVERIIAEFAAGVGARDGVKRTIFAVGDEKQSIFSFQGAAPREFDNRRRDLERRFKAADLTFERVSFTYSFRSGESVLKAVEHTFREQSVYRSITTDAAGMPPHMALDDAAPGMIDLWPLEQPDAKREIEGWDAPFDTLTESDPEVRLAARVQGEIAALIASGATTGSAGKTRPLSYGDILILVRRRGTAFDAVIQALKRAGIPVAGADRLKLTEHIAVIDLMNLADALLLPQDDLALAVALKSPLFGLTDDDLLKIAPDRKGSLRDALALHAAGDPRLKAAHDRLEACAERATHATPFTFYAWLLGGDVDSGRARILRRLGLEANDALDEFLELALTYETKAPASLQGFMAWLRTADTEVKRDMEIARDEVRVMTVHGAKGLEAAVVFLIDTTSSPSDTQRLNLVRLPQGNAAPGAPGIVVWAGKKADDPAAVALARQAMKDETEDEYRRLLYVAMTRAADRLIVSGVQPGNRNGVRPLSWYDLIETGLAASTLTMSEIETRHGPVKRYEHRTSKTLAAAPAIPAISETIAKPLPAWLRTPAAASAPADILIRPSDSDDAPSRRPGKGESREERLRALKRGTLVHRLLQSLPDVSAERRRDAAEMFLARNVEKWPDGERAALAAQIIALIDDPRFKALFAPGSRAEVSIAGKVQRHNRPPALVSGQIDRLVVTPGEILIVDYKTNHAPPKTADAAPGDYVRQLALYRRVLANLYPGRIVRCFLLWTERPEMMEILAPALDAELARHHVIVTSLDPATGHS
ncbi:double-strand break repair helicase AddA [Afipia sp. TerB]